MPGSLMNLDGNVGLISGTNLVVYSTNGDFLLNKSLAVLPSPGTSSGPFTAPLMQMVAFIPA